MSNITDHTIDIQGCQSFYTRGGAGEPLLLLHGANGRDSWAPLQDTLAQHYDTIVPDHPGFGRSDSPDWIDNISDLTFFYFDVLDALQIESCHLAGHSLGGWLAAELAVRQPERFKSLSLCSAAGILVDDVPMGDVFMWNPEETIRNVFCTEAAQQRMLAMEPSVDELELILRAREMSARLAWYPRFHNPDLVKWLHRLRMPVLIQWGDSDKIFPEAYAHAYGRLISGARIEVYPNCGHVPMVEATASYLEHFTGFLQEASS
jgi:pimeloyl-ACP methyl ester carboxylesterase